MGLLTDGALTTLLAPVPEAEPAVAPWRDRFDPWARRGVPAHVTLLGPFLPRPRLSDGVVAALEAVVGAWPEPRATLARLAQLPGAISLLPDDAEPFERLRARARTSCGPGRRSAAPGATLDARNRPSIAALECGAWHPRNDARNPQSVLSRALTADLLSGWPELAPGARTGRARPHHVTVACRDDPELLEQIRADLAPRLPIPVRLREVRLLRWDETEIELLGRFETRARPVSIRAAEPADFEHLREIAFAAKAHWGYGRAFVRRWAEGLTFSSERARWAAEVDGVLVAWAALAPPADGACLLDDLWVDPPWLGRGIGSRLFHVAADRARELGATALEWGADPNAVGFYERMGGRYLHDQIGEWGRVVPWMGIEL